MSTTRIEQTRALHADIERSIRGIVHELRNPAKSQKRKVYQNHLIAKQLNDIQEKASQLLKIYEDKEGFRKQDIEEMAGSTLQETLEIFESKLSDIREYHSRFPNSSIIDETMLDPQKQQLLEETKEFLKENELQFSGEEGYGRYVDLHQNYNEYINMKQFNKIDYVTYLKEFHLFHKIKKEHKNEEYKRYLQNLYDYFVSFYRRTRPLEDMSKILRLTEEEFEKKWQEQLQQNGTKNEQQNGPKNEKQNGPENNQQNGTKNNQQNEIKNEQQNEPKNEQQNNQQNGEKTTKKKRKRRGKKRGLTLAHDIALLEAKITRFVEMLGDVIDKTRIQIEKKQTRTWEEIKADIERDEEEEEEIVLDDDDDEDDTGIATNPLNLPLGWDGKPIPYWLYKLHQLGREFKCEICGNYSYWGPRAFERHFQEWRHAHGMRCLRIPNTRHFHHITKINDAIQLWQKIKKEVSKQQWRSDMEEYEDEQGNVFTKRMYEDLKRQGLLNK